MTLHIESESEIEVTQSCPTLCDPIDCSLPGSSVQARILEWVVISFSSFLSCFFPFFYMSFISFPFFLLLVFHFSSLGVSVTLTGIQQCALCDFCTRHIPCREMVVLVSETPKGLRARSCCTKCSEWFSILTFLPESLAVLNDYILGLVSKHKLEFSTLVL